MYSGSFMVYREEGFVEFVVSKIQIRIHRPIRKGIQPICTIFCSGLHPIYLLTVKPTPHIDMIQIIRRFVKCYENSSIVMETLSNVMQ